MIGLFKLAFEFVLAAALFYGGIKTQQNYPNLIAKIGSLFTWLKSVASAL
jgi:hypothetical protein